MNKTTIFLVLLILFIAYYSSKANTALNLTYRIGKVSNFGFAPFPTTIKFLVEIIAVNPTDTSVNLQNADMGIYLSGSYIGRGVLAQSMAEINSFSDYKADLDLEDNTQLFAKDYGISQSITRIEGNGETGFLINCSVQVTDLLFAVGGVIEDLKNRKFNVRLQGTVKAELVTIPVDAQILLQIPKIF